MLDLDLSKNYYEGSDDTLSYSYDFKVFQSSHLRVVVRVIATGAESILTLDTDYSVTGAGATSGTIELIDANQAWITSGGFLSSSYALVIMRVLPIEQSTSIKGQGSYYPELHENQFDKQVMIDQQLHEEINRSVKLAESADTASINMTIPASYIGSNKPVLMLNSSGDGFVDPPVTYSELAAAITTAGGTYTASRALVSSGAGVATASGVTSTELGYVSGVTSAIQTQLAAKQLRSVLTTKGDLYVATASDTVARQAVGTDGYALVADSAQTNGIKYANIGVVKTITTVTSGIKTPGGTNRYHTLTTNSLTLTAGTYELSGYATFLNSGTTPTYTDAGVGFYGANGADSSSVPAALSTVVTVESGYPVSNGSYLNTTATFDALSMPTLPVLVTVASSATVYIVTYSNQTTSANARITASMTARRLY